MIHEELKYKQNSVIHNVLNHMISDCQSYEKFLKSVLWYFLNELDVNKSKNRMDDRYLKAEPGKSQL